MVNIISKLPVIFSTTATANRASVGMYYKHISVYDLLTTRCINGIGESYRTLISANKKKQMKTKTYNISVSLRKIHKHALIGYEQPFRNCLTSNGLYASSWNIDDLYHIVSIS